VKTVKVFEISGELTTYDEHDHLEILNELFEELKKKGLHFAGVTKEITTKNK
jgi:hypothetical protein